MERRNDVAVNALITPNMAKAGNSRKDTTWYSSSVKAGKFPKYARLTMVPVTEAMTMGENARNV